MDENKLIAVVGVSENPDKFGYKIFTDLIKSNFKTVGISMRGGIINGKTVYKSLKDLPEKPGIVLTAVPPAVTEKIVNGAIELGIKEIWMQPGSQSEAATQKARTEGIKVTYNSCFMVVHGIW
ncbi:MAG: CoA-binding protein [Endomicrobium sp.]|jgi:predicted CoA-binding protein|nr:CoA-binding protein [Endomicrobium sp.]